MENLLLTGTTKNFVSAFEEQFSQYLTAPNLDRFSGDERLIATPYAAILPGQTKYSDWDLYFSSNEAVSIETLADMDAFIKSFQDYELVRDYVTCADFYPKAFQRISSLHYLQHMAFMPQETTAPFIDIHVTGVSKELLEEHYRKNCGSYQEGYFAWALITYWRKFKNGKDAEYLAETSILPALSADSQEKFKKDPELFMKQYFENKLEFAPVIKFLE